MPSPPVGPGPRTRVRRLAAKARYDESLIYSILDEAHFCHVAALVQDRAVTLPTLHARDGDVIYLHGSPSNAVMNALVDSGEGYLCATLFDGLRLARSGFESSIAYRSVVVVGSTRDVVAADEKAHVLDLFVERVLVGRSKEVRPASDRELRLTKVVAITIDEASAKVSEGPTEDSAADQELPIWAGLIPARVTFGVPRPYLNGAMASGAVSLPESVVNLLSST